MSGRTFRKVVGTGGIGTGMLFLTDDGRTLGRNESRLACLSDAKDYCKQHIVLYYTAVLTAGVAEVCPIGCVGRDAAGETLLEEMRRAGMRVDAVQRSADRPTTVSCCLQYPDKDGCNVTASNGASSGVTPAWIADAAGRIGVGPDTIAAAIPEVSVEARMELLRLGRERGAFCALSVPQAEAEAFLRADALRFTDLLAVNRHEALAMAPGCEQTEALALRLYEKMTARSPRAALLMTCGGAGAVTVAGGRIEHVPALPADAVNTTGAGDAFLGGVLAGLCAGLPLQKGRDDRRFGGSEIESAAEVGALCAGMAVESADSIAYTVTRESVRARVAANRWPAGGRMTAFLDRAEAGAC